MGKFSGWYKSTAMILLNTFLLFLLVNLIASLITGPVSAQKKVKHFYLAEDMLKKDPKLMQRIYNGRSTEDISSLQPNMILRSHPVLEFMSAPDSTSFFQMGFENCRYNYYINGTNFHQYINGSTWIFGGSTAFGTGLPGDETISYYLNEMDSGQRYINFGCQAYHQKLELQKLLLLLQKGYRPSRVIFIDGLNDFTQIIRSHFDASETPARTYDAFSGEFNIASFRIDGNLLYCLPAVRLYYEYLAAYLVKSGKVHLNPSEDIYRKDSWYHTRPYLYYILMQMTVPKPSAELAKKVRDYYTGSLQLLEGLSKAYHFEYAVFLQPLGMLYEKNVFLTDPALFRRDFQDYPGYEFLYSVVRNDIRQKRFLGFYDISGLDSICPDPYLDLTHYSPGMNKSVAGEIFRTLKAE